MRWLVAWLGSLLLIAPAISSSGDDKPKLKLKAPRTVFMRPSGMNTYSPAMVQVRAELEGAMDTPEEYYCLGEAWEWGDETESFYEPDCDPYKEGAEVKRTFSATHTYRYPGNYTILLRLQRGQRGKDTVITGRITVNVRGG